MLQVMPTARRSKQPAGPSSPPSQRLRHRVSLAYDEELADEEDADGLLQEQSDADTGSDAADQPEDDVEAPPAAAARGRGRGRGRGKGRAAGAAAGGRAGRATGADRYSYHWR